MLFVLVIHSNNRLKWRLTIVNYTRTSNQNKNIIYCKFCWTECAHQHDLHVHLRDPGVQNFDKSLAVTREPMPGGDLAQCCETSQPYRQMRTPLFAPSPKECSPVCDCIWALFTRATGEKFSYKPILTYISVTSVECLLKGLSVEEAFYLLSRKRFVTVITMC